MAARKKTPPPDPEPDLDPTTAPEPDPHEGKRVSLEHLSRSRYRLQCDWCLLQQTGQEREMIQLRDEHVKMHIPK